MIGVACDIGVYKDGDDDLFAAASSPSDDASPLTYHERQVGRLCGMHCVNNLLQQRAYKPKDFYKMEKEVRKQQAAIETWGLSRLFRKISRSVGRFEFSVQALDMALGRAGFDLVWFDRRKDLRNLNLEDEELMGIVVNETSEPDAEDDYRHWFSIIRDRSGKFYNMDSQLSTPECIGDVPSTLSFLRSAMCDERTCVFRVTRRADVISSNDRLETAMAPPSVDRVSSCFSVHAH